MKGCLPWQIAVLMAVAGCAKDSTAPASTGTLRVATSTGGTDLPAGYNVRVDSGSQAAVAANGIVVFSKLSAGSHRVTLTSIAENCSPSGSNPRSVDVIASATAAVAFDVACTAKRILFVGERSGSPQVYVMNPDGSGQTQITHDSLGGLDPAWSPDRTRFVYASVRGFTDPVFLRGYYAITVRNADGSDSAVLADLSDTFEPAPAWSPDGKTIAFWYANAGSSGIYLMKADGTGLRQFWGGGNIGVAWSPDGSKIALSAYGGSGYNIFVKDVNGPGVTQLTTTAGATDRRPSWSPDGTRIAFVSNRDGNDEIYVMHADGSGQTRLTTDPAEDFAPMWSPDGTKIAFQSNRSGTLQIYVMNADGSALTQLTTDATGAGYPSWAN